MSDPEYLLVVALGGVAYTGWLMFLLERWIGRDFARMDKEALEKGVHLRDEHIAILKCDMRWWKWNADRIRYGEETANRRHGGEPKVPT